MALEYAPAPVRDPIAEEHPETKKLMLPRVWIDWFASVGLRIERQAETLHIVELFVLGGTIPVTPIPTDALNEGLYRLTYYMRVQAVAANSSSLQLTLGWVDEAVACFQTFPALTTNTIGSVQSGTILVRNDQASPLTYQVTYASDAAGQMKYNLFVAAERLA